jgi:hypothetical protein
MLPITNIKMDNWITKKYLTFVGWSFRNFDLFYKIKSLSFEKHVLFGLRNNEQKIRFNEILKIQTSEYNIDITQNTNHLVFHDNLKYSEFIEILNSSIAFIDFDGVSANNAVVECIKYNIPLIVRECDAVKFYLGDEYPLYYNNEYDINKYLSDYIYIESAIVYLQNLDKSKFTITKNIIKTLNIINDNNNNE